MAFDLDLPKSLMDGAAPQAPGGSVKTTAGHFRLVNHQLKQARGGGGGLLLAFTVKSLLMLPVQTRKDCKAAQFLGLGLKGMGFLS